MKITKRTAESNKGVITLFELTNNNGASVEVSNLGAGIVKVIVPDAKGNLADVTLGYENPADYIYDGPCAGKTPGRYANRIAKGHFTLDGVEYTLAINNGPNALHGGPDGFHSVIWEAEQLENGVRFTYNAKDGEEGYPGNLKAVVEYTWNDANELTIDYSAETDKHTVINLTNHAYFNLAGENAGSVLDHKLQLNCSKWLPTDPTQIPTGELAPVAGTPMDFTVAKPLGQDIKQDFEALNIGKGYDHCWMADNWEKGKLQTVAILSDDKSGRVLEVATTQPGAQVYTGNWLAGSPISKSGRSYNDYDGVAIECQGAPDAPNHSNLPSQELQPGEKYHQVIKYSFKTK